MIMAFEGKRREISPVVTVGAKAMVIGDVEIGAQSNIWFHRIVRGEMNPTRTGSKIYIQEAALLDKEVEIGVKSIASTGSVVTPDAFIPLRTLVSGTPTQPLMIQDEKAYQISNKPV